MKITHVISDSNIGGAGILLSSVATSLKNDFNFEIILPCGSLLKKRLTAGGLDVIELPFSSEKSFSWRDTVNFYEFFKKHPTDILHTHAALSARLGGKMAGIETCLSTRHCAKPDEKIKKQHILKRIIYNYCTDRTISTADFATVNLIKEGVSEKRITTIKNGSYSNPNTVLRNRADLLAELGIGSGHRIIGSCARLEAVKGQDLILRAAQIVLKEFPNTHFLFLGDGSMSEAYKRLACILGIEKNVTFLGYVSEPASYQNLFYINLNASRGTETSCLATSECMSLGIPTVASDFGGNTEMVKDFKNGMIFSTDNHFALAECIKILLSDTSLHKKLSLGAKSSFANDFSAEKMAEQYKRLYSSLGR